MIQPSNVVVGHLLSPKKHGELTSEWLDLDHEGRTGNGNVEGEPSAGKYEARGQVESQVLDAAQKCIQADKLQFIYTVTTIGVAFRVWFYKRDGTDPVALHGEQTKTDRSQYIDADSDDAWVLPCCRGMVKGVQPPRSIQSNQ